MNCDKALDRGVRDLRFAKFRVFGHLLEDVRYFFFEFYAYGLGLSFKWKIFFHSDPILRSFAQSVNEDL